MHIFNEIKCTTTEVGRVSKHWRPQPISAPLRCRPGSRALSLSDLADFLDLPAIGPLGFHRPVATGCPPSAGAIEPRNVVRSSAARNRLPNHATGLARFAERSPSGSEYRHCVSERISILHSGDNVMQSGVDMFTPILTIMPIMAVDNNQ